MTDPTPAVAQLTGRRLQVFTDFDGTLAEIVADPLHVELAADVRTALEAVAAAPGVRLAVVSGRDLANLRDRVRLPDIAYAGNHGLEIAGPGFVFTEPAAKAAADALATVIAELRAALPGVTVQDKRLTATVHVPNGEATADQVRAVVAGRFPVTAGRVTIDIRPAADWHKGSAVRWLRDRWADPDVVPIFLGDDPSDEDGFRACADGLTVLVGPVRPTSATYHLAGPTAVARFLQAIHTRADRTAADFRISPAPPM